MKIKIINRSKHQLPDYHSAGLYLRANLETDIVLKPKEREVCIVPDNLSAGDFVIRDGERICQMVISLHEKAELVQVDNLEVTGRVDGGFGHTGKM